ncbi:MAG TPA: dTDP-4-dehydrorhamnose reductase [Candidatus Hydrogenedentes bacterium]|nr:dTDP-4-dehydrorhamnose reductase [Candidatus Hydrogenedentota bacterium]HQH52655.1 dTDP-4-dehydrorhamnose reductase [Candidatus Hydrogenedentota bacterium]HQM49164.1 dTDP-4-dehydrorhamnose reductase [Candidatus Hydrogenedentota bacterium]
MKVLVIGAAGQLGRDVSRVFQDATLIEADLSGAKVPLDLCDPERVRALIADELRPDIVINTAAAHNVPECEKDPAQAFAVNASGVRDLARICHHARARLVHISTDYVFGNGARRPYVETDAPAPLNVYGASKVAGEYLAAAECRDLLIVRTSAIYGHAPCRAKGGKNFVELMLHLAATKGAVKVVTDEVVSPTFTLALARQIRLAVEKAEPGVYHATSQGECSWFDFARAIFEETNTRVRLDKATSADFPSPVRRPDYSVLDNKHLREQGLDIMPGWRESLQEYFREKP